MVVEDFFLICSKNMNGKVVMLICYFFAIISGISVEFVKFVC
jgi:hypothetical protein